MPSQRPKGTWIAAEFHVILTALSPHANKAYLISRQYRDRDGCFDATHQQLGEKVECCDTRARQAAAELERSGLWKLKRKGTKGYSNIWYIPAQAEEVASSFTEKFTANDHGCGEKISANTPPSTEENSANTPDSPKNLRSLTVSQLIQQQGDGGGGDLRSVIEAMPLDCDPLDYDVVVIRAAKAGFTTADLRLLLSKAKKKNVGIGWVIKRLTPQLLIELRRTAVPPAHAEVPREASIIEESWKSCPWKDGS